MRTLSTAELEADLVALKRAAERAGTSLACLFSSADEFEADVIRTRRAQGAFAAPVRRSGWWVALQTAMLSFVFLML